MTDELRNFWNIASQKSRKPGNMDKSRTGLGHSYSRGKVKFNVDRFDNMVIQVISTLDTLDKDINSFSMRFILSMTLHAKVAESVEEKSTLGEDKLAELTDIVGDEDKAKEIIEAAKASMGG
ncbi:hypothetical protein D8674_030878 [Pyrus ussuriensis x Pyrus communis]|uniref:Uncharacterized protein n=1 Tax=Pyrus ussuriensis x Pyrus communis TaxID=2448454 RepID=A0A5N5EWV2_9ROSA|nr:hypothetical protein D8674_030878 [Pyrus ussuriensis x Pyrus communis]